MGIDKEKMIEILIKRIDLPGAFADIVSEVLEPALDKMVADSSNPYDDMAKAALFPMLETAIKGEIEKLWDKLQGKDEEEKIEG